MENPEKLAT